jgi:CRISPR-associated protein Cas2
MWIVVMFDLPTDTKKARKQYSLFRKLLLEDGFDMMQYSIYSRHCTSEEKANVHIRRIEQNIPPDGEVRILSITDKQFEKMRIFWGKMRKPTNKPPRQLEFF